MGEARILRKAPSGVAAFLIIFSLLTFLLQAEKLEITKKAGDYTVEVAIERDPPTVGKNAVEIRIKDGAGTPVREAKVRLNYYMPPMPRMAPMNSKVEAKWKKNSYQATLKLIMAGPWIIILRIGVGDKTLTTKFQIDAR